MISINEVDVGIPGRAEQHGVAQGLASGGVRGRIFFTQIGLEFHNPASEPHVAIATDENLAEKIASDSGRIAGKK